MPLRWKKEVPTPSPPSLSELVHEEVTSTSITMPKMDFMLSFVSAYWIHPQDLLQVKRVKVQVVTFFWSSALHREPLVLLVLRTHIDVVINLGELPCLSEKSNRYISPSISPKALGVLFYGSGSGKLNVIFFVLACLRRLHTNADKQGVLE